MIPEGNPNKGCLKFADFGFVQIASAKHFNVWLQGFCLHMYTAEMPTTRTAKRLQQLLL